MTDETENTRDADYKGHRQRLKARFVSDIGRSMPDYELLELLLTYALPRRDVKPLAKALMRRYSNFSNVLVAPTAELVNMDGIGEHAAILIALVHACANKLSWENLYNYDLPVMTDKKKIAEFFRTHIGYSPKEQLMVVFLDIHGKYIRDSIEQVGTIGAVMISPRDIIEKALMYHASRIIISHNHPSGDCSPSVADIEMTKRLKEGCQTMGIVLEDHIIISSKEYYSMRDRLPFMSMNSLSTKK